ncbi:MAG: hypothetical protein BWY04_01079 [candidate division CPR1 bacterium ADurb.Bin160]|uniref:Uncharacterized protein n=1 Tax=candidate division CPR1 bacterium ADurb.Bin160 TaxID=1852826 RepID=A0A1V5ZLH2_9BACT|nr:MAG: hypothetical protein BWY04_01079 [candidate division CPR1 bacterium ADurb.Bin160]
MRNPSIPINGDIVEEGRDRQTLAWESTKQTRFPSWDRHGLETLMAEACREYERMTGHQLPHNLPTWGPWVSFSREGKHYTHLEFIEQAARFVGWLRTAAQIPELVRFIKHTTSHRGVHSPHNPANLWGIAAKHPSPQKFTRWAKAVRKRAAVILEPWGLYPAWRGLAIVANRGSRRVGRAAIGVVRYTVEYLSNSRLYRKNEAKLSDREYLLRARGVKEWLSLCPHEQEVAVWAVYIEQAKNLREGCVLAKTQLKKLPGQDVYYYPPVSWTDNEITAFLVWHPSGYSEWLFQWEDGWSWLGGQPALRPGPGHFWLARTIRIKKNSFLEPTNLNY